MNPKRGSGNVGGRTTLEVSIAEEREDAHGMHMPPAPQGPGWTDMIASRSKGSPPFHIVVCCFFPFELQRSEWSRPVRRTVPLRSIVYQSSRASSKIHSVDGPEPSGVFQLLIENASLTLFQIFWQSVLPTNQKFNTNLTTSTTPRGASARYSRTYRW